MALDAGARLGPYEIVAPIGAGGMGEVYRARDTRLDRTVAIKVLPASLAADPQLRERFDREARTISSLNHPHICTLYDVGHQDGVDFLVLEYLEGETLDARLKPSAPSAEDGARGDGSVGARGSSRATGLEVRESLTIAMQIADALDKAHRAGIVHRDLKPANVMLTKSGAKLLDFGLAKSAAPAISTSGLSMLPTTPPNLTAQGTILGTFQYMAPEQIEGLEADARTDIFAFGAVLFEMLTGRPAFEGKTRAQLLGAILKDEPPPVSQTLALSVSKGELDARGSTGSPRAVLLDRVVATCLAKDPDDRWQTARDLLRELKWAADAGADDDAQHDVGVRAGASAEARRSQMAWVTAGAFALALVAVAAIAVRHLRETPPVAEPLQFAISAPENAQFGSPPGGGTGTATQLAISPDGRQVVFVAKTQDVYALWLRPIATLTARQLPGTEGAAFPFWSPDSRFIGFFAGGKLKKVQASGGPPIVLCDAASGRGGTWSRENIIVFAPSSSGELQRVSGAGGVPVRVSALDTAYGETNHRWPYFLPDGRHFLYTGTIGTCCPASRPARIKIGALDTTDGATLLQAESASAFAFGHLFFVRDGTLMAQPFDPTSLRLAGDAFPAAETVGTEGSRYGSFSASDNGTLVYARGVVGQSAHLIWFDRTGKRIGALGEAGAYLNLALSPDERRAAVTMETGSPGNLDVWTIDIARGVSSRLTFDPASEVSPVWSPDSTRVVFQSLRAGELGLRVKSASGAVKDEPLLPVTGLISGVPNPDDWSADGRFIVYEEAKNSGVRIGLDLWILPMPDPASTGSQRPGPDEARKPFPFIEAPGQQTRAAFSPDSRWIAYASDETGNAQVYVQPFPPTGGRFQVSKDGGIQALWRRDGKELFFLANDGTIMAAPIDTTRDFQPGIPQPLFNSGPVTAARRQYAVSRDGQRFLTIVAERSQSGSPLTVVVNWLAAVQK